MEEQKLEHGAAAYFKTVSPQQIILHTTGEQSVSKMDMAVISDLHRRYHLPDEVTNVLIQYILLASLSLQHPSVLKVAVHWQKLKVKTAEKAMELVKKEHQKYKSLWMTDVMHLKPKKDITLEMIRGAADSNLTDEQLGAYIRELFTR